MALEQIYKFSTQFKQPTAVNVMYSYKDKNILAIDDYEDNLFLIQCIFETLECKVKTACNAKIGLIEVQKSRPDLIILDLMMPDMSGIEFINCLKNDNLLSMPVLLLTANLEVDQEDVPDADSICYKPIDVAALVEEAGKLLLKGGRAQ